MRYLALDFETSGLNPDTHAPVSLGVALMESGEVLDSREWIFAPPTYKGKISREYSVTALEVSRITWKQIKAGKSAFQVMTELWDFATSTGSAELAVVAFNAPFDFAWYSTCLFLGGGWDQSIKAFRTCKPPLVGPWQCARLMASVSLDLPSYTLDAVAGYFGLPRSTDKHGALEDAILAGRVYNALARSEVTA